MADNLQNYFKKIGKTPLLSKEEEVELSKRIEAGDQTARATMINANMRLAISIAKNYINQGCDFEDLIQESSLGLMKAVDRYDWRKGFKFSTYACWWIKQSVRQYVSSQGGSIRLPSYAKNMLWKMRKIREEYEEEFGVSPTTKEIADLLGTTEATLSSFVTCASNPIELDGYAFQNDESNRKKHEILSVDDGRPTLDEKIDLDNLMKVVRKAMKKLTPREEAVLRLRFGISEIDEEELEHANA
tara:strand:- start:363 stop:1094 length:732 start_codon:yes stop_codon:yes gene_type:complete